MNPRSGPFWTLAALLTAVVLVILVIGLLRWRLGP